MSNDVRTADYPVFTAPVDWCIVEGFLSNRLATIRKLKIMGFSRGAVLDRAKHLGLSTQFLKWCAQWNPAVALRSCLQCGESFLSVGFHNRLCQRCKNRKC